MATDLAAFVSAQLSMKGCSADGECFAEYHAEIMDALARHHIDDLEDEDEDKDH
jgi:predicted RNase H-like HicB family nuclease